MLLKKQYWMVEMSEEPELLKHTNKVKILADFYGVPYDYNGKLESFAQALVNRELRDHFAGLAMQTLPKDMNDMETLVRMAYIMADAMIAERDKND